MPQGVHTHTHTSHLLTLLHSHTSLLSFTNYFGKAFHSWHQTELSVQKEITSILTIISNKVQGGAWGRERAAKQKHSTLFPSRLKSREAELSSRNLAGHKQSKTYTVNSHG